MAPGLLLVINLLLLGVGIYMYITPAVLIFTPIFLPVVTSLGVDPLHFGIIMVLNLSIGLCTPPVGSVLFVGCGVGQTSITRVIRPLLPLYLAMLAALLLVTFVPGLSTWVALVVRVLSLQDHGLKCGALGVGRRNVGFSYRKDRASDSFPQTPSTRERTVQE